MLAIDAVRDPSDDGEPVTVRCVACEEWVCVMHAHYDMACEFWICTECLTQCDECDAQDGCIHEEPAAESAS